MRVLFNCRTTRFIHHYINRNSKMDSISSLTNSSNRIGKLLVQLPNNTSTLPSCSPFQNIFAAIHSLPCVVPIMKHQSASSQSPRIRTTVGSLQGHVFINMARGVRASLHNVQAPAVRRDFQRGATAIDIGINQAWMTCTTETTNCWY
jgi:hypothetical protein